MLLYTVLHTFLLEKWNSKVTFYAYAGNRIQAAYVPTGPANISATYLNPMLGDALVIFSRGQMQFGVQIFIQELLIFLGNGLQKLILFWCLFRTCFTIFKTIQNVNWQNLYSDQAKHLIGSFFQRFPYIIMLESMFASVLII